MMTHLDQLVRVVHETLWKEFAVGQTSAGDVPADLDQRIRHLLANAEPLASSNTIEQVVAEVLARVDGLGPLHEYGQDPAVSEIMVNGDGQIWLERAGRLECTERRLEADAVDHLIRRLAASVGRRIDFTNPSVDVRLSDGSRLHAIIPPLAVDGPSVTIRRFRTHAPRLDELATATASTLLQEAVEAQQTIIVAGGTSSGKTTLLNALAAGIAKDARIVTIEDAAELRLPGRHIVRLETRRPSEGAAEVTLRELTRHALRMRPDRIICGEMRGPETLDLIQAMNTGHRGSMSTVHANTPADVLRRIETMMLLADAELPLRAIRDQLASCLDLVVMMERGESGERKVSSIARVPDRASNDWVLETLYDKNDEVVR